jgi:hypothetical protein
MGQGNFLSQEKESPNEGLATYGHCDHRLHVHYRGRNSAPGYNWAGPAKTSSTDAVCTVSTSAEMVIE